MLLVGIGIGAVLMFPRLVDLSLKRVATIGRYEWDLQRRPAFLEEHMALEMARKALEAAGFDVGGWLPVKDGRSRAPNGARDTYLVRNAHNSNRGTIRFHNERVRKTVDVNVDLKDSRIVCEIVRPL